MIRNHIDGPNASVKPCSKMTLCLLRVSPLLLFSAEGTFRLDVFQGDYTVFYKVNEIYPPPPHPSTNVFARKVDRVSDNSLWLFGKHHHITRIWGCKYNLKQLKKQICMLGFVTKKGHSDEFSPYFVFTAATKCNQFTWNMIIELHPFFIDSSAITAIWFCLPWW